MDTRASRCAIRKLHAPPSREAYINPNPKKGGHPAPHRVTFLTGPNRDFPKWRRHNVWQPPQFTFSPSPFATSPNRAKPTAPASPWQNGFAERLIGSIRRECLDHVIIRGEAHLRRILKSYADYYNGVRTHRSLNKDAPVSRPLQLTGIIRSHPILGGLHHHYVRV